MRRSLVLLCVATLALTAARGATFGGFAPQQTYPCGGGPRQMAAADFNGDGIVDLATANGTGNSVSILLGNGDGTFGSPTNYPTGALPQSVVALDLNGDGIVDLTVANGNDPSISVLFGVGDGTFVTHQFIFLDPDAPPYPGVIMVHTMADFDGDGAPDIAVATLTATLIMVLPNDGTGTFGAPQVIGEQGDFIFYTDLEPGDFNGDGLPDLISTAGQQYVQLFMNNGDGTFAAPLEFTEPAGLFASPFADLNGDGNLDLIMSMWQASPGGYVLVAMGNGDGTFGAPTTYAVEQARCSTTCDIDRDGDLDLIVPSFGTVKKVSVMLNNGDGTLAAPLSYTVGANNADGPVAADLDGDLWPDVATVNRGGGVSVLINLTELPGDLNCDGAVNNQDIDPFVLALFDAAGYATQYPNCDILNGDFTGDGYVNNQDIDGFIAALFGG